MSEINGFYQHIDGRKYRNIYVVGDIHGCYNRLINQLAELNFDTEQDLLVSVGDLIDRGLQSLECLALIQNDWFRAVKGNHEQMAIETVCNGADGSVWFHNGGDWYLHIENYRRMHANDLIKEASRLPLIIEVATPTGLVVVAHADYPSEEYAFGKAVDENDVIWSRERYGGINQSSKGIVGADKFFFGHTPTRRKWSPLNLNYIDTGAVFGGALTIVQVQGGDNG